MPKSKILFFYIILIIHLIIVVDIDSEIDINTLKATPRVALRSDSYITP